MRRLELSISALSNSVNIARLGSPVNESEGGVAEVFFGFFEHAADAFLFRDVVVQLLNVFFSLLGALMFELGAGAFSFFGVSC